MARRLFRHTASFIFACAAAQASAVELGEAKVNSYIGQQLVADIELTSLQDQAASVQARLASRDVYQGAGIDMPAVLSSLNMNVMRRDGKQFLHLTSLKPVEGEHLHVYLELTEGGQKTVRLATLWFTPDPTPPVPVTAPVPLPAVSREPAPPPLAWPKPKPARPQAVPLPRPRPQPEAACRRGPSKAEAVCAALDGKNAELQAKLLMLEGRVRALQAEAQAAPEPAKQPAPPTQKEAAAGHDSASGATDQPAEQHAEPKVAKPAEAATPAVKPAVSKPAADKPAPPEPGMPWAWIAGLGAAVFALVGGWQLWRSRRKGAKAKPAKRVEPSDTKPQEAEASEEAAG
ncbi:hypothetical protein NX773_10060 [Massilia solisilvae]|uniref:FimV N-terminal domain-containing protein n=1 Tax=Massilia solisilvae TaxID=1811225 RepID=A0ABT2BJ29_9BURK|nr:hypothetical protein [Massilia solisilvae]MCS0608507.1 hypothetical protein [Massilia solisilvae]